MQFVIERIFTVVFGGKCAVKHLGKPLGVERYCKEAVVFHHFVFCKSRTQTSVGFGINSTQDDLAFTEFLTIK